MTHPPFAILKLPLLLLLAALLLTVSGVLWGQRQAQEAGDAMQQQQTAFNQARQQLDRSSQQQRLVATHLDDYQTLVARGFVGAEDRLAWIEAVQLANRDAGLYGLSYRLMPRTVSPPALSHGLPLGQTRMILTLPLLVETDLTRFLAALRARAVGVYHVQGCHLTHPGNAPFEAVNRPHLQAECDLLWFTVTTTPESHHE